QQCRASKFRRTPGQVGVRADAMIDFEERIEAPRRRGTDGGRIVVRLAQVAAESADEIADGPAARGEYLAERIIRAEQGSATFERIGLAPMFQTHFGADDTHFLPDPGVDRRWRDRPDAGP